MPVLSSPAKHRLIDNLDDLPELRPFPAIATRLMSACQDPKINTKTVGRLIECDPALAMRLLRLANSSLYGVSGRIKTVDHAIVILGFRAVRDLAISIAGAAVFAQGKTAPAERRALWQHSLGCATVARLLARRIPGVVPEEAFLAGVFHDVGKLVFYDLAPAEYGDLHRCCGSSPLLTAEEHNLFGITHEQLGQRCGEDWGLPDSVDHAIGFHHAPAEAPNHQMLVALTHFANSLAKEWIGEKVAGETASGEPSDAATLLERTGLPIDAAALDAVRIQAAAEFTELQQICGN